MNQRMYYSEAAKRRAMAERIAIALGSAILGAGIGTIMALLFAPSDGEDNRETAKNQLGNVVENTRDALADAYDSAQSTAQQLQKKSGDYVESVNNGIRN